MNSPESPFLPHGGYRKLRSYKVSEAVYDATVVFCRRFYAQDRRMSDQMVQAARSGVRNISEGSGAAATSRKSEMKLTNIARASLSDELLRDYESFLVQNGLRVWPKDSREALAMRARLAKDDAPDLPPAPAVQVRLRGLARLSEFVERAAPELAANAMVCVVNQAAYLLKRQLESQGQTFVETGGFTEKLYGARSQARRSDKPDESDRSDKVGLPACPLCGHPMARRIARKGPKANQPFWGCSRYPDCKATLAVSPSETSGQSDTSDHK
jgi:four helix bundle suffix protein